MRDTLAAILTRVGANPDREALRQALGRIVDRMNSASCKAAGLVIKAGGGTVAKTGSTTWYGTANGKTVTKAAATDMPPLTGINITANKFNVVCFFVDETNTVTAVKGVEATSALDVVWPECPDKSCLLGSLLITHSSTFTGGTTPLDTATTVYGDSVGAYDPTFKVA